MRDAIAERRHLGADATRLPPDAGVEVETRLGHECRLANLEPGLSRMRPVREQLEQCRRAPGAAGIHRKGDSLRWAKHETDITRPGGVVAPLAPQRQVGVRIGAEPPQIHASPGEQPPALRQTHLLVGIGGGAGCPGVGLFWTYADAPSVPTTRRPAP